MIRPAARTDVTRSAVLAHLGARGSSSRAELARELGVSPALMTQITKELLAAGLVVELEHSPSQGGRPAQMLGLATSAGTAIGVKVAADHLALVEVGIDGTMKRSASEPFDANATTVLSDLSALIQRFISGSGSGRLLGVGVGLPGSVDEQHSGVVDSTQLDWRQVPVGESLRRALHLPVLVENNVNALAVAERLYGIGRRHDDFLVITIGTGIGAAIVVDGVVLRGAGGGAGEIGHFPVAEDGHPCSCGNRGCLETLIGEAGLIRTARERGALTEGGGITALRDAADAGDLVSTEVFGAAGHQLGRSLAGIVHTIDPEAVILLGEGTLAWPHWALGFEPAFRSALLPSYRGIGVFVETWQDDGWARGAAALVLATPFDATGATGEQGRLVRARLNARAIRT
ncbi:MAG: ROK family transcriptional regulator [Protaetiibacter sp.]